MVLNGKMAKSNDTRIFGFNWSILRIKFNFENSNLTLSFHSTHSFIYTHWELHTWNRNKSINIEFRVSKIVYGKNVERKLDNNKSYGEGDGEGVWEVCGVYEPVWHLSCMAARKWMNEVNEFQWLYWWYW